MTESREELVAMVLDKLKKLNVLFDDEKTPPKEKRQIATAMAKLLTTYFQLSGVNPQDVGDVDIKELMEK